MITAQLVPDLPKPIDVGVERVKERVGRRSVRGEQLASDIAVHTHMKPLLHRSTAQSRVENSRNSSSVLRAEEAASAITRSDQRSMHNLPVSAHSFLQSLVRKRGITIPCRRVQRQVHGPGCVECPGTATSLEYGGRWLVVNGWHEVPRLITAAVIIIRRYTRISTSIRRSVSAQAVVEIPEVKTEFRVFEQLLQYSLVEVEKKSVPREEQPCEVNVDVQISRAVLDESPRSVSAMNVVLSLERAWITVWESSHQSVPPPQLSGVRFELLSYQALQSLPASQSFGWITLRVEI
ncbi:hypothetical protein Mapa_003748 [Marchantia paleacea]|nr:hypothetical protein Mapa_003748 [Marchantia paleacea]